MPFLPMDTRFSDTGARAAARTAKKLKYFKK
jgi:hypothetical protein